jgi:hypothetical protein
MIVACRLAGLSRLTHTMRASQGGRNGGRSLAPVGSIRRRPARQAPVRARRRVEDVYLSIGRHRG